MKYIFIPLAIVICAVFIFLFLNRLEKIEIQTTSGSVFIKAEVVTSPEDREKGLMKRSDLPEEKGMLFVYNEDINPNFWMKNMLIPIDIIFIDADHNIKYIAESVQPCESEVKCELYNAGTPVRYVLEVKSGYAEKYDVVLGNKVLFRD
jgi:uncharacterized membrane protein (UPF0127 family)